MEVDQGMNKTAKTTSESDLTTPRTSEESYEESNRLN